MSKLENYIFFSNGKTSPTKNSNGKYPIFGSNGIIGYSDKYNTDSAIIIGRVGAYCGSLYYSEKPCWVTDNAIIAKVKNKDESLFWFYYLKTKKLNNMQVGTGQPLLNQSILKSIQVLLPKNIDKIHIGNQLNDLDKKIDLNTQINQTLEQIAQAIFKSWFIDFDPVRAKADAIAQGLNLEQTNLSAMEIISGKNQSELALMKTKQADKFQSLYDLANAFPCEFEVIDDVEVPKGWSVKRICDIAEIIKGKSYKSSELQPSKTALVTLKSFNRGGGYRLDGLKEFIGKYKPEQEVFPGDLIVAYTDVTQNADIIGKPAMVMEDSDYEHLVISLDVGVVRPNNQNLKYFLYCLTREIDFQNHTKSFTTGTTVLHLGKDAIPSYQFVHPDNVILDNFSNIAESIFEKTNINIVENKNLSKTRDSLLPKLLKG
ncbi:MAG: restriction endonuclease subunit S [Pasteurellaceae bacterium]|nr:restriction endonuclease subunit S [Pasteurellaceae bacterium]